METSKYDKDKYEMFTRYLDMLNTLALSAKTHERFVKLQKVQDDILNDFKNGKLWYREGQALLYTASILMKGE